MEEEPRRQLCFSIHSSTQESGCQHGEEGGAEGVDMFQNILSFHSLLSSPSIKNISKLAVCIGSFPTVIIEMGILL